MFAEPHTPFFVRCFLPHRIDVPFISVRFFIGKRNLFILSPDMPHTPSLHSRGYRVDFPIFLIFISHPLPRPHLECNRSAAFHIPCVKERTDITMTERVEKTNKKALWIVIVLYACTLLCLLFDAADVGIRALWQIAAVAAATGGIQLTQRYLLSTFAYVLTPDDELAERNTITIVRIQGKRRTVLGNLSLAFAYALEKNLSVRKTEKKHGRVNKIFNFLADIGPNREYALLLHFQESTVLCRLQCSEEFADALRLRLGSQDCTETPRNPDKA